MERESLFRHIAAKVMIFSDSHNKIGMKNTLQKLQRVYIVVDLEGIVALVGKHLGLSFQQIFEMSRN